MSRTYRAARLPIDCSCGAVAGWSWRHIPPTEEETERELNKARRKGRVPYRSCRCKWNRKYDYYSKRNHKRDNKPRERCDITYKKMYGRSRKAKIKQAMRNGDYESIPIFHMSNDDLRNWDYY